MQAKETTEGILLSFGEVSTVVGLSAIEKSEKINVISIGALFYKNYGYATEEELPKFETITQWIEFLTQEENIGLIDFKIEIIGKGTMSSHDDGDCTFLLNDKKSAMNILKKLTPDYQSQFIISALLKNKGIYISVDENNTVKKFAKFDDYLRHLGIIQ